jgi:sterol desaturase/sphingolipid hydroxylase (fatty acid hydroxylase superfamily)
MLVSIYFSHFTTIVINFLLAFVSLKTADWTVGNNFGILQWLPEIPLWLYTLIGLLLLDLIGAHLVHLVEHKTKFLWRFHLIQHTDTWIDTTTNNRSSRRKRYPFYFTTLGVLIVEVLWMVFSTEAAHENAQRH